MIKNNRNNEQIYGRNDMIMLDQNNKIYGSLGLADKYVMRTEEGTRLVLNNPKQGRFGDVLTEFNMYGRSEQFSTTGAQLFNENIEIKNRGVTIKINGSTVTFKGTVSDESSFRVNFQKKIILKPGKYTASSSNKKIFADFSVKKANDKTIYSSHIEIDGTEEEVRVRVLFGERPSAKGDIINETTNIMVNEGDIALPYEPYTGGKPSPSPEYPQEIKSVVNPIVKVTNEDGKKSQTVTLPYKLNAIPVTSGGNVTIDGQQYVADYVDVERGKLVRMCKEIDFTKVKQSSYSNLLTNTKESRYSYNDNNIKPLQVSVTYNAGSGFITRAMFTGKSTWNNDTLAIAAHGQAYGKQLSIRIPVNKGAIEYFTSIGGCKGIFQIETPEETDLMPEQIQAYKSLSTYYPVTIIENNYNTWMKATYKSTESV